MIQTAPEEVERVAKGLTKAQHIAVMQTLPSITRAYEAVDGRVRMKLFQAGVLESSASLGRFRLTPLGEAVRAYLDADAIRKEPALAPAATSIGSK